MRNASLELLKIMIQCVHMCVCAVLYLMMVGMTSAVKRMHREAVAWEENSPSTEKTVMAVSLRSGGKERDQLQ